MFILQNLFRVYREKEGGDQGGGEGGGSGGGADGGKTYSQADFDNLQSQIDAMQSKNNELLGEVKQHKAKSRQAAEDARVAAEEKARKDGDFEQLFKSSEEQRTALTTELEQLRSGIATDKQQAAAMKLATQLADGDNADLLAQFIAPRLKYTEEGVKVLDSNGQLTVSTVDDLKSEFQNSARYAALLRGNQASGGGASGGKSGGAAEKTISRSEFDGLTPIKQMEFSKAGGVVTD